MGKPQIKWLRVAGGGGGEQDAATSKQSKIKLKNHPSKCQMANTHMLLSLGFSLSQIALLQYTLEPVHSNSYIPEHGWDLEKHFIMKNSEH